ncbi:hypothetical protein [Acetobacter aceti]|uniref:Uncharacterized protein n=1 Tax=Acetobacter aceti TaxID=435 RepID=A0A6S6PU87_ACEAC|nr:hypothetical protein [Acetobacter aceti]BCI68282.1 hypothetical protein AAJCM20276_29060 [Acetobacter aceti]
MSKKNIPEEDVGVPFKDPDAPITWRDIQEQWMNTPEEEKRAIYEEELKHHGDATSFSEDDRKDFESYKKRVKRVLFEPW